MVRMCLTAVEAEMGLTWRARQRAFTLVYVLAQTAKIGNGSL